MPRRSFASLSVPVVVQPVARLEPPDDLVGPERGVFVEVVLSCPAAHFRPADGLLLAAYARAVVLERRASAELALSGPVADGKPSPWLAVLAQASKSMLSLSRQLRLSPLSRSPTMKKPGPVSYYERAELEGRRYDQD